METEKAIDYFKRNQCDNIEAFNRTDNIGFKKAAEYSNLAIQALELLKLKEQGKVIITPCAVGDQVETKYGDTWRVDGFTTYGDDLKIWCEGENERYVEFSQHEIIKYIPREDNHEKRSN